jgi:hypothetical protein
MLIPPSARSVPAVVVRSSEVGDPSASRTVYVIVVVLVVIGIAFLTTAVWLFRQTRVDAELLAPLERMDTRRWRKADPARRRRLLDESRPEDAEPLSRAELVPDIDAEFADEHRPVQNFDDFVGVSVDPERSAPGPDDAEAALESGSDVLESGSGDIVSDDDVDGAGAALESGSGVLESGSDDAVSGDDVDGAGAALESGSGADDEVADAVSAPEASIGLPPPVASGGPASDGAGARGDDEESADSDVASQNGPDAAVDATPEDALDVPGDEGDSGDATPHAQPQPLLPGEGLLMRPAVDDE